MKTLGLFIIVVATVYLDAEAAVAKDVAHKLNEDHDKIHAVQVKKNERVKKEENTDKEEIKNRGKVISLQEDVDNGKLRKKKSPEREHCVQTEKNGVVETICGKLKFVKGNGADETDPEAKEEQNMVDAKMNERTYGLDVYTAPGVSTAHGASSGSYGAGTSSQGANSGGYGASASSQGANSGGYGASASSQGANSGGYGASASSQGASSGGYSAGANSQGANSGGYGGTGVGGYNGQATGMGGYGGQGVGVGGYGGQGAGMGGYGGQGVGVGGYGGQGAGMGGYNVQGAGVGGYAAQGVAVGGYNAQGMANGGYQAQGVASGGYMMPGAANKPLAGTGGSGANNYNSPIGGGSNSGVSSTGNTGVYGWYSGANNMNGHGPLNGYVAHNIATYHAPAPPPALHPPFLIPPLLDIPKIQLPAIPVLPHISLPSLPTLQHEPNCPHGSNAPSQGSPSSFTSKPAYADAYTGSLSHTKSDQPDMAEKPEKPAKKVNEEKDKKVEPSKTANPMTPKQMQDEITGLRDMTKQLYEQQLRLAEIQQWRMVEDEMRAATLQQTVPSFADERNMLYPQQQLYSRQYDQAPRYYPGPVMTYGRADEMSGRQVNTDEECLMKMLKIAMNLGILPNGLGLTRSQDADKLDEDYQGDMSDDDDSLSGETTTPKITVTTPNSKVTGTQKVEPQSSPKPSSKKTQGSKDDSRNLFNTVSIQSSGLPSVESKS